MGFFAEPVDENVARQVANIIGPSGAYAKALAELDRRRAAGEDLIMVKPNKHTILIVPRADLVDNVVELPAPPMKETGA